MSNTETTGRKQYPYHRRFVRHRVRVKVQVQNGKSYSVWTINLSNDGLCFEIPHTVAVGKEVVVTVFLTRDKKVPPVTVVSTVVWNEGSKGRNVKHGGQFIRFDGDGRERLEAWLKRI